MSLLIFFLKFIEQHEHQCCLSAIGNSVTVQIEQTTEQATVRL